MSATTHIQWTDATWNPVTGCNKVSAGCKHCYAQREWARLSANPKTVYFGRDFGDVRTHPDALRVPLAWRKPRMVFVCSMSDLFHPAVPDAFIVEVFYAMQLAGQHTYQVLTKRPERARDLLRRFRHPAAPECGANVLTLDGAPPRHFGGEARAFLAADWPLRNVWIGTSVEDQAAADARIPALLQTPAAVRWLSCEPLLGAVDLTRIPMKDTCASECCGNWRLDVLKGASYCGDIERDPADENDEAESRIDWVVTGGESGAGARPTHPTWVRSLRDQCAAAGAPFFFKQWGEWAPPTKAEDLRFLGDMMRAGRAIHVYGAGREHDGHFRRGDDHMLRVGKKTAGRLLDGVEHNAYPAPP